MLEFLAEAVLPTDASIFSLIVNPLPAILVIDLLAVELPLLVDVNSLFGFVLAGDDLELLTLIDPLVNLLEGSCLEDGRSLEMVTAQKGLEYSVRGQELVPHKVGKEV